MSALAAARALAIRQVDDLAELACQKWASRGPCRNVLYLLKREEARACAADPSPIASAYPMLAAELGITGDTLAEVAAVVLGLSAAWIDVAATIERTRLLAHRAITEAETVDAVWSAAAVAFLSP